MQPVDESSLDTRSPIERRLAAFVKKYRGKAREFAEADIKGGLWLDDDGNFYFLIVPIDIDTTFYETSTIIAALATDPNTPAFSSDGNPVELSKREFAAITLRVPQSGIDWLDEMIRTANRRDMVTQIYAGYVNSPWAGQYPEMLRNYMSAGEAVEKVDTLIAHLKSKEDQSHQD